MSSTSTLGKGEWICPDDDCGNRNFSKRDKCHKCGQKRKDVPKAGIEIGKSVAEKSKGLFSADDWMCKSCGNINWARRNTCNICNTNKVNTQGQRTGFGGGFNERDEVIEYNDRNDEDDEYDEFGMIKKKFRGNKVAQEMNDDNEKEVDVMKKVEKKPVVSDDDEEEEAEESDEDSDDADLSKYDLWGDDVDATKPLNNDVDKKRAASVSSDSSSSSGAGGAGGSSSDSSESSAGSESSSESPKKENNKSETHKRSKNSPRSRSRSPINRR